MLGAGFVTKPTLDILTESGIPVTVGTTISSLSLLVTRQLSPGRDGYSDTVT